MYFDPLRDLRYRPVLVGRTWADIFFSGRKAIFFFGLLVLLVVLIVVYRPDFSGWFSRNGDSLKAFFFCFIVMFYVGRWLTFRLISVQTIDYLVLDFVHMRGSVYRIPVSLASRFTVSGANNLQFSWRDGHSFKLARSVDLESGIIETAWPHEISIEQAAFSLSDLQLREKDYRDAKIENLLLRRRPVVIAADLAKESNGFLASELSDFLKLGRLDLESYLAGLDPLDDRRQSDLEDLGIDDPGIDDLPEVSE